MRAQSANEGTAAAGDGRGEEARLSIQFDIMWPFRKTKRYEWKKEQGRLWRELVPVDGQADTLQGELIRIAGKLTDEAYRNGNMNWDADHARMWRFIGETIAGDPIFTSAEQTLIREKIAEIIRDEACPDLSGDGSPYYIVTEKVVDWCMAHPKSIPHEKDPTLKR